MYSSEPCINMLSIFFLVLRDGSVLCTFIWYMLVWTGNPGGVATIMLYYTNLICKSLLFPWNRWRRGGVASRLLRWQLRGAVIAATATINHTHNPWMIKLQTLPMRGHRCVSILNNNKHQITNGQLGIFLINTHPRRRSRRGISGVYGRARLPVEDVPDRGGSRGSRRGHIRPIRLIDPWTPYTTPVDGRTSDWGLRG